MQLYLSTLTKNLITQNRPPGPNQYPDLLSRKTQYNTDQKSPNTSLTKNPDADSDPDSDPYSDPDSDPDSDPELHRIYKNPD
jgi:hypothetical protein